jgi:hypothetical protein
VAVAAEDKELAAVERVLAEAARRLLDRDVHPLRRRLIERHGEHVLAVGVALGEERAPVEEGKVRGQDHVGGADVVAVRLGDARRVVLDVVGARVLEDAAAVAVHQPGQGQAVAARMELRLVVEAHRGLHRPRQVGLIGVAGGQAGLLGGFDLLLDLAGVGVLFGVGVGRAPLPVAPMRCSRTSDSTTSTAARLASAYGRAPSLPNLERRVS